MTNIFEKGDNLKELAKKLKVWFEENNVEVPKTAREWQSRRVTLKNVPAGYSYAVLQKNGVSVKQLIALINDPDSTETGHKYNPITRNNILDRVGLHMLECIVKETGHKSVTVRCDNCNRVETLDYGTLQRMEKSGNKNCRYCRNAGGKTKSVDAYDVFDGFKAVKVNNNRTIDYTCNTCTSTIYRTFSHVLTSDYIVCEKCHPNSKRSVIDPTYGKFDSIMELESYKKLLKYFPEDEIQRQVNYDDLFQTGTKHTLDFYIPRITLYLEVTTKQNKLDAPKYFETRSWKESFGVKFATTLQEVDDIVRSAMKVAE